MVSGGSGSLAGSDVEAGQRWAVGFLVTGALGRAFPHVCSLESLGGSCASRSGASAPQHGLLGLVGAQLSLSIK